MTDHHEGIPYTGTLTQDEHQDINPHAVEMVGASISVIFVGYFPRKTNSWLLGT